MRASWLCGFGVKILLLFFFSLRVSRSVELKLKGKMQTVENYDKTKKKQFISCVCGNRRKKQPPQIEIKTLFKHRKINFQIMFTSSRTVEEKTDNENKKKLLEHLRLGLSPAPDMNTF